MHPFVSAALGGVMLGLAAVGLMLASGRILGISGIFGGVVRPRRGDFAWRALFVGGMAAGGAAVAVLAPEAYAIDVVRSPAAIVSAGLLVGFGTRLGSGCTSGHGICGISRFSPRSLVAVLTFMATGALAAFLVNHVFGGSI